MDPFGGGELRCGENLWGMPAEADAMAQINIAIDEAAMPSAEAPRLVLPDLPQRRVNAWLDEDRPFGYAPPPPPAEETLLDVLPVSVVAPNDSGKLQVEPDVASLQKWDRSDREAAIHVTSWLNDCAAVRPAIERAIGWGVNRFEDMSREYDERLEAAGYDRADPSVQERDSDLRHLHETVEHARDILDDLPR